MTRWSLWGPQVELHGEFHVWALILSPAASGQAPSIRRLALSIRGLRPRSACPWLAVAAAA